MSGDVVERCTKPAATTCPTSSMFSDTAIAATNGCRQRSSKMANPINNESNNKADAGELLNNIHVEEILENLHDLELAAIEVRPSASEWINNQNYQPSCNCIHFISGKLEK